MPITSLVSYLFFAISFIFFAWFCLDCLNKRETSAIARKIRLRMALMFAAVGAGLVVLNSVLH